MTAHVVAIGIDRRTFVNKLDFGVELLTARGIWIPDSDRRAQRWLWKVRQALRCGRVPDGAQGLMIVRIDQVLVRYQCDLADMSRKSAGL